MSRYEISHQYSEKKKRTIEKVGIFTEALYKRQSGSKDAYQDLVPVWTLTDCEHAMPQYEFKDVTQYFHVEYVSSS